MKLITWYPAAEGEKRTVKWFALIPVWINKDFRWLERVVVEWEYTKVDAFFPPCLPVLKWKKMRFVNE